MATNQPYLENPYLNPFDIASYIKAVSIESPDSFTIAEKTMAEFINSLKLKVDMCEGDLEFYLRRMV